MTIFFPLRKRNTIIQLNMYYTKIKEEKITENIKLK